MEFRTSERHVIASISCGRDHTLALLENGRVFGWGGDGSGRMPASTTEYCSTLKADSAAVELHTQHALLSVAAGYGVSLGITATSRIAAWGATAAGVGGRREAVAPATPQLLAGIEAVRAIAAGEHLFGAVDVTGTIHTWGLNHEGALGRPTEHLNAIPGPVALLPPANLLAVGRGYMLALTRDGLLYAWGSNAAGQLGLGHLTPMATPQPLKLNVVIRSVAAGATHALAVTTKGEVLAWGSNHHGQLEQTQLGLLDRTRAGSAARARPSYCGWHALFACAR